MAAHANIRAVIFDMDGVLTDSEPLINKAAITMFGELGLQVSPADFLPFIGAGEDRYLSGVAERYNFTLHTQAAKKRTYEIYLDLVANHLHAFPGAIQLVEQCRTAGLLVALASSADKIKILANLHHIGLPPESWSALVTGEEVDHKKPAPDIFLAAARKLGVAPAECVVIEDAVNGIEAAKAAGMRCVAVAQSFDPVQLTLADLVRPHLSDVTLKDLIGTSAAHNPASLPPIPPAPQQVATTTGPIPPARANSQPWGFWSTLGLATIIAVAALASELGALSLVSFYSTHSNPDAFDSILDGTGGFAWSIAIITATPITIGLVILFARLKKNLPLKHYLALRTLPRRRLLRWCLVLLGFALLADLTTVSLGKPIVPEFMTDVYRTAGWTPLLWFAVVLCAPLAEELLFRGFLFKGWLHSPLSGWGTVLLTSFIWATLHQQYDLHGIAIVFAAGLLFGYARLRSGSIYPALAMHLLMNLLAMIQTALLLHYLG